MYIVYIYIYNVVDFKHTTNGQKSVGDRTRCGFGAATNEIWTYLLVRMGVCVCINLVYVCVRRTREIFN